MKATMNNLGLRKPENETRKKLHNKRGIRKTL